MRIKTTISLLLIISLHIIADNKVFTDELFPYRIVCEPEWIATAKTDDTLTLEKTTSNQKKRFQLIKHQIDTSFYKEDMTWSLMNFIINKELAGKSGRLIFFDTSATIKLGNHRAYELFAFFCDTTGEDVWWADYCRWTDYNGIGFFASIIGDTTEMKANYDSNQSLLDSVCLSNTLAPILHPRSIVHLPAHRRLSPHLPGYYDMLGKTQPVCSECNRLLVGRKSKLCRVR